MRQLGNVGRQGSRKKGREGGKEEERKIKTSEREGGRKRGRKEDQNLRFTFFEKHGFGEIS